MNLKDLGWDSVWADTYAHACRETGLNLTALPGRIMRVEKGRCQAATEHGRIWARPGRVVAALGDWAAVDAANARLLFVLPARNRLERMAPEDRGGVQTMATNFQAVAVVMGLDADYNLKRLERYLALIDAARARPVVLLNKSDRCADPYSRQAQVERAAPGARVETICAIEDDLAARSLAWASAGETLILTGSSGAGKSTIVNSLLGAAVQATMSVRASDGRGQHCTTRRELFVTPLGALVADLPGIRMVGPVGRGEHGEAALPVYDPHDPRQAASRKRYDKEMSRAVRACLRLTNKW